MSTPSLWSVFKTIVSRDLSLATRVGGGGTQAVIFFCLTVTLMPLGVGPELNTLARIAPGVLWVLSLLACLLSLDRLFQADYEDGSLDMMTLSALPLELLVLAKCLAHWLSTGLPLMLAAPVLGILLNLQSEAFIVLIATFAIGTPALSLIGAIGAALTLGIRRGGVLISLLILPLYVPVLIFAVGAVDAALFGLDMEPQLLILGAISLGALAISPFATAAALRLHLD